MKDVDDVQEIIDAIKSKQNLLITGKAGSGKSYFITNYAKTAFRTALTATTGISALSIRGETINRFLGLSIISRPEEAGRIIGRWEKIKSSKSPWDKEKYNLLKNLDTLIIDEASMLRRDQFELCDCVLSYIKDKPVPFGGTQIILVADFFQLPPVVTSNDLFRYRDLSEPYCFQSDLWKYAQFCSFNLTTSYRQSETEFLDALNNIRIGNITKKVEDLLNSRIGVKLNVPFQPMKLFPLKVDVRKENLECLKQLPGPIVAFDAEFEGNEYDCNILKKECPAETILYFAKGAQVMMINNDSSSRWVNGTFGRVIETSPVKVQLSNGIIVTVEPYTWERTNQKIEPNTGKVDSVVVAKMKSLPFLLAYSNSLHRCQSLTLDYIDIDLSNCFTDGQFYSGISRVKTLGGLTLRGWNKNSIKVNKEVLKFYGY